MIGIKAANKAYNFGAPTPIVSAKIAALQLDDAPASTAIMTGTFGQSM